MTRYLSAAMILAGTFALTGCPPQMVGNDASDTGVPGDTRQDTGGPADSGTGGLYKPCARSADCGGTGFLCDLSYPGGLCTKRCTTATICGAAGTCGLNTNSGMNQCYPICTHGSIGDCNIYGGACSDVYMDQNSPATQGCTPSCFAAGATLPTADPPINNTCVTGRTCDPYTFTCEAQPGMYPGTAEIGAACATPSDCKTGTCYPETVDGMPTGFVGGYCLTFDARYPGNLFSPNMPYPRGNCPMGTGSVAGARGSDEGDYAICLGGCTRTNAMDVKGTCRGGYRCLYVSNAGGTSSSSTGVCDPIDCNATYAANLANKGCPTGYTCQVTMGSGDCVPATTGDAGTADTGTADTGTTTDATADGNGG